MRRAFLTALCLTAAILTGTAAFADGCSAVLTCTGGQTVQCSGSSTCSLASNGVNCDGLFYSCPQPTSGCPAQYTCPTPPYSLAWYLRCFGSSCLTDPNTNSITCDGQTYTCDDCEYSYSQGFYSCRSW